MNQDIKPIETIYKNYRFRSRLEARWAVFFDALKIRWEYEKEGYVLPSGAYLPDFWLPDLRVWVEIKPGNYEQVWELATNPDAHRAMTLAGELATALKQDVVVLFGYPYIGEGDFDLERSWDYRGMFIFGDDQSPFLDGAFMLQRYYGETLAGFLRENGYDAPEWDGTLQDMRRLAALDMAYFRKQYGREHHSWRYGILEEVMWSITPDNKVTLASYLNQRYWGKRLYNAGHKAQQARFEHGEKP